MSDEGRTEAVQHVEATAAALYAHEMGQTTWPLPYSDLTVRQQDRWRGEAYCAAYALARCPVTGTVHPWLRSWCEPSCREATP